MFFLPYFPVVYLSDIPCLKKKKDTCHYPCLHFLPSDLKTKSIVYLGWVSQKPSREQDDKLPSASYKLALYVSFATSVNTVSRQPTAKQVQAAALHLETWDRFQKSYETYSRLQTLFPW